MTELTINGKKVQAPPKSTILQAALGNGIYIPHLCWDRRLLPYGGCRLCLVEVEGQKKLLAACSTPAEPNMIVHTETPKLAKARRTVLELLLVHHPLDCPVCDKAGECELQELAFKYGPSESRFQAERKHDPEFLAAPLIERNPNRCILCGKCVRVCKEHQGVGAINLIGRGFKSKVSPAFEETLDCEFCGQCVDSCPVGALGTKPYRFRSRVWFMDDQENICPYCSVGCTTVLSLREGRIIRARGKDGAGLNEGDLCPRGRFGFDFIESEHRLSTPLLRKGEKLEPVSWQEAFDYIAQRLGEIKARHGAGSIGAIGSERCSVEDNYMLRKFMTAAIGSKNLDSRAHFGYSKQVEALRKAFGMEVLPMDLNAPLTADVLFVLESDLTSTHPIYGLKVLAASRDFGGNLIVADSKESKLARWSNNWLRIRPATGVALVNGIMKAIIDAGLHDRKAEGVKGFDALKKGLENYAPEKAQALTGIPAEEIKKTAKAIAEAKNPMFFLSIGSAENTKGESAALALANLAILVGRGPEALGMPAEFANSIGLQLAFGDAGKGGLNTRDMLYGKGIKALYLMGENPVITFPDTAKVEETLKGLELLIVQDIMLTETAAMAHVVLPASSWAEKEGTFVGLTGKPQKFVKCLPETGTSTADWKILRNLGRAMQVDMGAKSGEELAAEVASNVDFRFSADKATPVFNPVEYSVNEVPDSGYPLLFATGNLMQHSGSLTTISKNLGSAISDAYLQVNPKDAKSLGLADEGYAKISGRQGAAIYLKIKVTDEVPQGMTFAPAHFAHAKVNLLTTPSKNGEAPTIAVKVEAAAK
ncbi:MAG: molybdopterin-dependent oxidoreductase [Nitrospiraceae bacterium]|nr:molybdopterin-dependent oxidoreductase [Nitrospiraceae bacterium]